MQKLAVGIDIGGTNTVIGIVGQNGEIHSRCQFKTSTCKTIEIFISELSLALDRCLKSMHFSYKLIGMGIGAPNGNYYNGTIEFAPNLPWKGKVEIVRLVREKLELPVFLTNDANAAAVGEMVFGGAKGMKNFTVITLGTGLGSGIVVDGKVVFGADGFAGEMGHVIVEKNGRLCGCGRKGCLETYASATGIVKTAKELIENRQLPGLLEQLTEISAKDIYEAALKNDSLAKKAFRITGEYLGEALANLVALTSPEAIFLFGGLALSGDIILEPTRIAMENNLMEVYKNKVKICISSISNYDAAILGASALAWENFNS